MLYIRMLFSVVVSLYTSRVVLEVLGVEDYGLYGLVGGVVSMFSFLNSTMAGATSRFLTLEMGRGDEGRLKATFSSALIIHIGIALFVLLLSETLGLWFLNNKLVIPEGRMYAAHWVLQLSVLGMVVSFTQVPYNAAIIAHEKMDVYAYVELFQVVLKLGIVYLLSIGDFDKLILYSFLVLIVNILIAFIYRIYCLKNYNETRFSFVWDKDIIAPMFVFSGWESLGHFGYTFRTQGVNFVLNMFFGVALNAVTSIATTVQSTLNLFSNNVLVAIKPQIVKRYALGQNKEMLGLMMTGIRFNLLLQLMLTLPLILCMDYVLQLWLHNPPTDCAVFCRVMLYSNILSAVSQIIYTGIQTVGKLKQTNIIRNILYLATPILIYIAFACHNFLPIIAYVIIFCSQILLAIIEVSIFSRMIVGFDVRAFFVLLFKSIAVVIVGVVLNGYILDFNLNKLVQFVLVTLCTEVYLFIAFYVFVLEDNEKTTIDKFLNNFLNRIRKS